MFLHVYDGPDGRLYHAGPLMRVLRTLRRISSLLDEPVKPEKRSVAGGTFKGNLFGSDSQEVDDLLDSTETALGYGVDGPAALPSLSEEWVGLLDRTFLRLRRRWQKLNLGTALSDRNPYFESPSQEIVNGLSGPLYGISRDLGDISRSLQALQERHAPRAAHNPWPNEMLPTDGRRTRRARGPVVAAVLEPLEARVQKLEDALERIYCASPEASADAANDVSPPADASPPDDVDDEQPLFVGDSPQDGPELDL
jgi:hypothetical protein